MVAIIGIPLGLMAGNPSGFSMGQNLETDERRAVLPIKERGNPSLARQKAVAEQWYEELLPHLDELGSTGVVTKLGGRSQQLEVFLNPIDDGLSSDDVADRVADMLTPHLDLSLQAHIDRARGNAASSGSDRWNRRNSRESQRF